MSLLAVAIMVASLSSCGFIGDRSSIANVSETKVVLEKKNYKVVDLVRGESKQTYALGFIGGMSKESCNKAAIADMYENADLKGGTGARAIINVNITDNVQNYFLWTKHKIIATGVLVEFTE